jgi:hypothetical protein
MHGTSHVKIAFSTSHTCCPTWVKIGARDLNIILLKFSENRLAERSTSVMVVIELHLRVHREILRYFESKSVYYVAA